ncbi:major facilitator superfamily domain-containing protein [Helicostylum pulchrum]|nr:major facilitator superfamily domain-containing protein [Helicostylum pulchrum]
MEINSSNATIIDDTIRELSLKERLLKSQLMSCIAGSIILCCSFGIRQTVGVFLIPITESTGWDRSTFSIAAGLFQLFWGFSQPFVVYFAERKWGFGKCICVSCAIYAAGLFLLYGSGQSAGLFIFAYAIVVGTAAGGNSFPVILASIGRRFPQKSKQQAVAFGLVSSFGSFGQVIFLPIARVMVVEIDWRMSFVVLGAIVALTIPLSYFLQTIPPIPALPPTVVDQTELLDDKVPDTDMDEKKTTDLEKNQKDDFSAPDIKTALKEAFSSPIFIMISLGFSVCGFHVSFLATHLPAYLQDQGIDPSLAAWTMSILGAGSMIGSIATGYITNYVSPRLCLTVLYLARAILFVIFIFIPVSLTTVMVFSCLFGFLWLSTVPLTTKFIGDVFGHRYLGTLTSISFVGHQIGAFLGAYVGGVIFDKTHSYMSLWYTSLALAVFAVVANFFAGEEPVNMRRRGLEP